MFQDRRQYQRLSPGSPQLVLLDESKYSLLFDLGEGGLAVEGLAARKSPALFSLEFDLPEGHGCIQAKGEIAWTSDSGDRTGFRFVELEEKYRQQLQACISSDSGAWLARNDDEPSQPLLAQDFSDDAMESPAGETVLEQTTDKVPPETSLFPLPAAPKWPARDGSEHEAGNDSHGERTPAYVAGALLALVVSSVSFLMGYYWRGRQERPRLSQASGAILSAPIASAVPNPLDQANSSLVPAPFTGGPGFVLQVAAMEKKANADALSARLRQENFPAFVFKRGSERFYRVVVGPFPSQDAAAKIEGDLETRGFQPLPRRWSSE